MRLKPVYDGYSVKLPNGHGGLDDIGGLSSAASVQRLVEVKAFVYQDGTEQINVRLEQKGRGSSVGYWMAYKRCGGKLRKAYVSEAFALDPHNLDAAAKRLLEQEGIDAQ